MREIVRQVRRYYELGLWSEKRVRDAVAKNAITAEEFKDITGNDYSAE